MISTVSNLIQLQNFAGASRSILVTDQETGGEFNFKDEVLTPDGVNIITATGLGGGYWVKQNVTRSEMGEANGVATLDGGGKVPGSQLPNSIMELQGFWDANTNTPTLADGVGNAGDIWIVDTAGTTDFGSGAITFALGDFAVYAADGLWHKSLNSNAVISVNGETGAVEIGISDIPNLTTTLAGKITQGGDSLGTTMVIGTNDDFDVQFERNNVLKAAITNASLSLQEGVNLTNRSDAARFNMTVGTSSASAGITRTTADAVAALRITNANDTSTGDILQLRSTISGSTSVRAGARKDGRVYGANGTAADDFTTKGQLDLKANATDVVDKSTNQTGIAGNKSWTGVQTWETGSFHTFNRTLSSTTGISGSLVFGITSTGSPNTSSFGSRFPFQVQGTTIAGLGWRLDGALNSGALVFQTYNAGVENTWLTIDKAGKATFTGTVEVPTPTTSVQAANKGYVDAAIGTQPLRYKAILLGNGTSDPILVSVLENTLGGDVTWTRLSLGNYNGTFTDKFTENKTFLQATVWDGSTHTHANFNWVNDDTVRIRTSNAAELSLGLFTTTELGSTTRVFVSIEVYP